MKNLRKWCFVGPQSCGCVGGDGDDNGVEGGEVITVLLLLIFLISLFSGT